MSLFSLVALDSEANGVNVIYEGRYFNLIGYFGVHSRNTSSPTFCSSQVYDNGVLFVEAMRYAINKINSNNASFLLGNRLGYRIIDSCKNAATLRRSLFRTIKKYYMGIVGPPTSDEAIIAATVHSAYKAAVVSNFASSTIFEDRNKYPNFFRTIPSDYLQVEAFTSIINHFNWSYVSAVNSYGSYGKRGMELLIEKLTENGKCVAKRIDLPDNPTNIQFQKAIKELTSNKKARVVIMFTNTQDTKGLLMAAKNTKVLTWVSSTSWYADLQMTEGVEAAANGSLILQYGDSYDHGFMDYFMNMTLMSNDHTWFREFWSQTFNCSTTIDSSNTKPLCTGNEDLRRSSFDGKYLAVKPVLNAVDSIACALRRTMLEKCPKKQKSCIRYQYTSTYALEEGVVKYLKNGQSSCKELNNSVNINKYGYHSRDFLILNFDGSAYREIGFWKYNLTERNGRLTLSVDKINWKDGKEPVSLCSLPCNKGERKVAKSDNDICCFTCEKCTKSQVLHNNSCVECGFYERAYQTDQTCKPLPTVFMEMTDAIGSTILVGSSFGIFTNTAMFVIFFKFRNSRIVRASSRELSLFIIFFLYICFSSPIVFLIKPSKLVCGLQRFIVGLSLTGCYTPLMLKTNRIYRIFKASKTSVVKPMLVGSISQIFICLGLIGIQLLLGIMWLVADPPKVIKQHIKNATEVAVACKFDTLNVLLNLIPCFVLTAICTVYAFKTRKFPSNFNEAYSIGITMYICCFLWGIFIPLLLLLELNKDNIFVTNYVISGFIIAIAFITLIGLFGPKLRKLLFQQNIGPSTEYFSEVNHAKTARSAAPSKLAIIREDASQSSEKRDSLPHLRACQTEFSTKDVSTNT